MVEIKSIECNSVEIKPIERNSIDTSNLNKISEAMISNPLSHEDFITIINEEKNYRELKESIRMMKVQEEEKQILINLFKYKTMLSYCLKCKKNTESINPKVSATINGRTMILLKCAICGSNKSKFIKNQEAKGLLSSLGIRTSLTKIPFIR